MRSGEGLRVVVGYHRYELNAFERYTPAVLTGCVY